MRIQDCLVTALLVAGASAAQHDIAVGRGGLRFDPSVTTAATGDTVVFHFYPRNHSVARSSFESPCNHIENGFYSGFIPSSNGEAPDTFVITVSDSNPIWLYCPQFGHCQGGQVGVINPPCVFPFRPPPCAERER